MPKQIVSFLVIHHSLVTVCNRHVSACVVCENSDLVLHTSSVLMLVDVAVTRNTVDVMGSGDANYNAHFKSMQKKVSSYSQSCVI